MWWLALSLLLLCIIERGDLMDPSKVSYFNIFALSTYYHVSFPYENGWSLTGSDY